MAAEAEGRWRWLAIELSFISQLLLSPSETTADHAAAAHTAGPALSSSHSSSASGVTGEASELTGDAVGRCAPGSETEGGAVPGVGWMAGVGGGSASNRATNPSMLSVVVMPSGRVSSSAPRRLTGTAASVPTRGAAINSLIGRCLKRNSVEP